MGQGGNVFEWEETELDLVNDSSSSDRGHCGGSWIDHTFFLFALNSSDRSSANPSFEDDGIGFRVASVPEPSSLLSVLLASSAGLIGLRRRPSK